MSFEGRRDVEVRPSQLRRPEPQGITDGEELKSYNGELRGDRDRRSRIEELGLDGEDRREG